MSDNFYNENNSFRLVLPKKGRLKEDLAQILGSSDLVVSKENDKLDYGVMKDRRREIGAVETLIQRPMDALDCVAENVADMAVVGLDTFMEFNAAARNRGNECPLRIVARLDDVSACSLYIAGPDSPRLAREEDLNGLRIATSYPETLKAWLRDRNITPGRIVERQGGVEDTVRLGLADVICDVVQSGRSLVANNLVQKFKLADSCAVVVARAGETLATTGQVIARRLSAKEEVPSAIPARVREFA